MGTDAGGDAASAADGDAGPTGVTLVSPKSFLPYCSLTYPDGGYGLYWGSQEGLDPCTHVLAQYPGGAVQRAGLYSVSGPNNVLERCTGLPPKVFQGIGIAPLDAAWEDTFQSDAGKQSCVVTVAPAQLPVFSRPYGAGPCMTNPDTGVVAAQVFNFDVYGDPWNVADFGQTPNPPNTTSKLVDRTGSACGPGTGVSCGHTYVWTMPPGRPLLAVADGKVLSVVDWDLPCGGTQKEVFVEHTVQSSDTTIDAGTYAERFVVRYAGFTTCGVAPGAVVVQGQQIGTAGPQGCPAINTLDFLVVRSTNLTGAGSYTFQTTLGEYGINGIQGIIDPFGWGAPKGADPWAYRFIGHVDPYGYAPGVTDPGAFSIDLWLPGEVPPTVQ
jgi:hypothetical protein